MALHELQSNSDYQISALLTTITKDYDRISMHGVRSVLLEQQAQSLGLSLEKIHIRNNSSQKEYEANLKEKLLYYRRQGVSLVGFGDVSLQELRKYREHNLSKIGMKAIFPIWKRKPSELAYAFIDLGFRAVITCVDSDVLDRSFIGRIFDSQFLSELPPNVDLGGENGEFHSFVFDGPMFKKRVHFNMGEIVFRDNRYYFCDLIPVHSQ